ncbi:hypothetical protein [Tahibacter amnicola]|uniref:Uncharacterized protein n=1 Tax=Tahibacter amnicola TaxID=2976241 RepID=A0ABY6BH05_9GAMM|nr:hypothetical protein [Tahibacter amnicola]UXI69303.1 hypothetical protein N4264_06550 [Tahibacter amnicola]
MWDRSEEAAGTPLDNDYHVVATRLLSVVVPKADYRSKSSWRWGDFEYHKVKEGIETFLVPTPVDLVVAIPDRRNKEGEPLAYVLSTSAVLSLWYSPESGVTAVGFRDEGTSGSVFYCTGKPCLFGPFVPLREFP